MLELTRLPPVDLRALDALYRTRMRLPEPGREGALACGRKPIANAIPKTSAVDAVLRTTLAVTWPARTALPETLSDLNLSMMPPVMSWLTLTAVLAAPNPAHSSRTPGTR